MELLDWAVLTVYFILLISIGIWAYFRVKNSADFFTAGGKLPWWLSGISHHVSGYSGAVFVTYAGIAYTHGFTLYVWWAFTVGLATLIAAFYIAPRSSKLPGFYGFQSRVHPVVGASELLHKFVLFKFIINFNYTEP